ncbi:hypothetical protein FGO68_gene4089 [Halteria grandinella]|uniref:PWI domain-containing protein n=1 Tax=Halteria grandinella TaxID=5974 RepID=A0A8J8NL64_HALGN|nr:hypothetical protein FGO68_gene4089 [Halteria grandinella]
MMGDEDDIVANFAISQLEQDQQAAVNHPDQRLGPKKMQVQLTGFLEDKASIFMKELWNLLLSAQADPSGIPPELIREKLDERQRKLEKLQQTEKQLQKIKSFSGLAVEDKPQELPKPAVVEAPRKRSRTPPKRERKRSPSSSERKHNRSRHSRRSPSSSDSDDRRHHKHSRKHHSRRRHSSESDSRRHRHHHHKKSSRRSRSPRDRSPRDTRERDRGHGKIERKRQRSPSSTPSAGKGRRSETPPARNKK